MRLAFIQYSYVKCEIPMQVQEAHFSIKEWILAIKTRCELLLVIYRYHEDHIIEQTGVIYLFVKDRLPENLKSYHVPITYYKKVGLALKKHRIDVAHTHNPLAFSCTTLLRRYAPSIPIVVQDHGSKLKDNTSIKTKLIHYFSKRSLQKVNAVMFAAVGQEDEWVSQGFLKQEQCVFVMENSSQFSYKQRESSQEFTGMSGSPVYLWVGNLDKNKDPLTVLRAFSGLVKKYPKSRLYMIFRYNPLEKEVRKYIEEHKLEEYVVLTGTVDRGVISEYYNSSDYIISASWKEGSGYSVIEALSCGVIPILSNIPSFITLTGNRKIGHLYPPGDSEFLYQCLLKSQDQDIAKESKNVLDFFYKNLSFEALAKHAETVYQSMI